ncbi:MAG: tetratricopeptide repeat protein, partial [Elusimicrobia bacterium]|nr:tetratricopeptide repeat protein [Elusimicrobiota bacterium]
MATFVLVQFSYGQDVLTLAWNKYYAGDFKGAISSFMDILQGKETSLPKKEVWKVHLGLGYSYLNSKQYDQARESFLESLDQKKNYDGHRGLGLVEFQQKNYKAAIKHFQQSLKINSAQYDVASMIAWSYFRDGDLAKAFEGFRKQIILNPYIADPHYGIALTLDKKGDKKGALYEFYAVVSLLPGYLANSEFYPILDATPDYKSLYRDLGWALYFAGFHKDG